MKPFLPKRLKPLAFGLMLSGMMSFIVSGLSTAIAAGVDSALPMRWLAAWVPSWSVAFPAVLVVAPLVRGLLKRVVVER